MRDGTSKRPEEGPSTARGWRKHAYILLLAVGFLFFSYIARFGYGFLVPRLIEEMGLSRAEVGLAYSVFVFAYSALSAVSGRLFDRHGIRVVAALSFVYGLGLVLAGASQDLLTLTTSLAIAGVGASSSWTPMVALASSSLPATWRGRAVGLLEVGIRLSQGLAGFLIPLLVFAVGSRGAWWAISTPLFAYGLAFYALSKCGLLRAKIGEEEGTSSYRALLSSRAFWLVGLSYLFMSFASYIILTFMVDFLVREVGVPYAEASAVVGVMGLIGIGGAFLLSWASDRAGRVTVLVASNAAASLCVYLASLFPSDEVLASMMGLLIAVYGIFFGALWPIYAACAGDLFPSSTGTVMGLWTLMLGVGALLAPILGGSLADAYNSYVPALRTSAVTYIAAAMLMIATVGSWKRPSRA